MNKYAKWHRNTVCQHDNTHTTRAGVMSQSVCEEDSESHTELTTGIIILLLVSELLVSELLHVHQGKYS